MYPGRIVSLEPAELERLSRSFDRAREALYLKASCDLEDLALLILTMHERGVVGEDELVACAIRARMTCAFA